jgi:hypothetical protein
MSVSTNNMTGNVEDASVNSDNDKSIGDDGDNFVSDTLRRDGDNKPPEGKWTFQARTTFGAKVFDGLTKRNTQERFSLVYNPVDKYLLEKTGKEVKHFLSRGRVKIHGCDEKQPVTALDVFACAFPLAMLLLLKE